jgi:hypothetical protein
MAAMKNAGIDSKYAAQESQADTRGDLAAGGSMELVRHMQKANIRYNRLWESKTEAGWSEKHGGMNEGYLAAIDTAISNAKHKYGESIRDDIRYNELRQKAGKDIIPGKMPWHLSPWQEKLSLAMDEMHTIASLRGDDRNYEPRDLAGEYAETEAKKVDKIKTEKSNEKFKEKKDKLIKTFSGIGSAVSGAVSGAASTAVNTIGDVARPMVRVNEGREKATAMYQDLKSQGLSRDDILPKVMDMLFNDGFSIDDIDLMLQVGAEKFKSRSLSYPLSGSDIATDNAGWDAFSRYHEGERNKYKAQEKANEQKQRQQDRLGEQTFKDAEGNIINGGGRPYSPPVDGETPEQKTSRIANNERVTREYHRLRKEAKAKEQAKSVKKPVPPSSILNQKNAKQAPTNVADIDAQVAGLTGDDVAIDRTKFSKNQERKNARAGYDYDQIDAKNKAMLELYQGGWEKQNKRERSQALYAKDPGYRNVAGTPQEDWYLGVANAQIMGYGAALGRRLIDQRSVRGLSDFYKATGGSIGGTMNGGMDNVPAMLTPGEFVMSREAVSRHGVGYMKNLNMGKATGFRRGGVVGTGNVQYRVNGGSVDGGGGMMIDPSLLSGVLDTFIQNFSTNIDKISGPMSSLAASLQGIANAFSGLTMTHVFSGQIGLSVNVSNKDAIIAAVSEGITPMISDLITRQLEAQKNNFNAGG